MMIKLSAVILTLNEERNIRRCIESVQEVVDEVLVVDSLSTDQTVSIAEELGARVIKQAFLGYIEQKNFGLDNATYEYILALDADEALSPELAASIEQIKTQFNADGYTMNRLTNYCGKWIRHSGWYPDRKLRLFKRGSGRWQGTNPHDRYKLNQGLKKKHLRGDLFHYSYYSVEEHRQQIVRFTDIAAQAKYDQGTRSSILKIAVKPVAKFIKGYIIKLGVLDGYYGWLICTYSAYATYLKYLKLLRIQRNK